MPLDPERWQLLINFAILPRSADYRVERPSTFVSRTGSRMQVGTWLRTATRPGELERVARDHVDTAIRMAEEMQDGTRPIEPITEPTLTEVWRD